MQSVIQSFVSRSLRHHPGLVYTAPLGLVPLAVPFGFFGKAGIREMQGFLHSRWSVEMTAIGWFLNTTVVPVEKQVILAFSPQPCGGLFPGACVHISAKTTCFVVTNSPKSVILSGEPRALCEVRSRRTPDAERDATVCGALCVRRTPKHSASPLPFVPFQPERLPLRPSRIGRKVRPVSAT